MYVCVYVCVCESVCMCVSVFVCVCVNLHVFDTFLSVLLSKITKHFSG